ncbi:MAG: ATP-binding cassette domain-containing protein [Kovacikia sp.]
MTIGYQTPHLRFEQVSLVAMPLGARTSRKQGTLAAEKTYLLQDISFEVFQGDRISVVGASGAGKTTLLRLLNRLSEPTDGAIYFGDLALSHIPVIKLRQQVVLVLQESKLLGMSVQQALEYPLKLQKLDRKVIQQRVGEWIERLHIPSEWLDRAELQLSVGQRQLVAIARALIMQPKVLLLDEPTSALDIGRAELLLSALENLSERHQATVLMVNHQLELAEKFCDRVLQLHQGRLIQDSPKDQVDWKEVRQHLVQAEARQLEEWG